MQPALFELHEDRRPPSDRTAAGRYLEPSLFTLLDEQGWTVMSASATRANGQAYKGINVLMLWGDAQLKGFVCPIWMTYRQAQELGGQVKKGEHGSLVVYADKITRTETDESGEEVLHDIAFMKGYTVFNCEQIDLLPPHFYATATPPISVPARIAAAESFAVNTEATLRHGGNRAYYSITDDYVQMPPFECFRDAESFYATLLHELTHNAERRIMPAASLFPLRGGCRRGALFCLDFRRGPGVEPRGKSNWGWRRQRAAPSPASIAPKNLTLAHPGCPPWCGAPGRFTNSWPGSNNKGKKGGGKQ